MLYINNTDHNFKSYEDVCSAAIEYGIERKRVYLFLAMMGVTGGAARVLSSDGMEYLPPVKMAIKGKKFVSSVRVCASCKGLVIE